jgi:hypothetical protein
VPLQVHPHVVKLDDLFTLRPSCCSPHNGILPQQRQLGNPFCYLPTATKGKTYVYAEVNPELMQGGALPDPTDRAAVHYVAAAVH